MSTFGLPRYMINTATLGLYVTDRKFYNKGLGPAIDMSFNYNSQAGSNSSFGYKWSFAYESYIELSENRVVLTRGSGQKLEFTMPEMSQHPIKTIPPVGRFDKLTDYGDYWLYQEKGSKELYRYDKVPGTVYSMLTAHMDIHGNAIMVHYNKDGTIKALVDAAGREISFVYNDMGYCSSFSLIDGRRADFSHNDKGFMVKSINFEGIEAEYQYDADGYMVQMVIGKSRRTTTFKYTERGSHKTISAVIDARGNTTTYEITSINPRIVRVTSPKGNRTFYQSAGGFTEKITYEDGNFTAMTYDGGYPVSIRDRRGNTVRYTYDSRGNLLDITDAMGNIYKYAYDNNDNVTSVTNALGHVKTYSYDERENLVKVVLPSGAESVFEYDEKGQLLKVKTDDGREAAFAYNRFGNMEKVTNAEGVTSTYTYLPYGYTMKSIIDPLGSVNEYEYDRNNREKKFVYPDGGTILNEYDCCAGVLNVDENGNMTTYDRDGLSNIVRIIDAMDNTIHMTYDENNLLVKLIDPMGNERNMFYDKLGRLERSIDAMGNQVTRSLDPEGNVLAVRDALGNEVKYEYDKNNLVTKVIYPLGKETAVIRDALGRIKTCINGRGNKIDFIYDIDGRVLKKMYDGKEVVSYEYLFNDDKLRIRDAWGTREIVMNKNYQPIKISYPNGQEASFVYNALAYLETMVYGNVLEVKYHYDRRGRMTRVEFGRHYVDYFYDGVGNLLSEARSNGTQTIYSYDAANVLLGVTHKRGEEIFAQFAVERDALNNILSEKIISPIELKAIDHRIDQNMKHNSFNQLVSMNGNTFSYDADGNLIEISDGKWSAVYDSDNRPLEIVHEGVKRSFIHDGDGERVKVADHKGARYYNYDPKGRLLFETNEVGEILKCCIYGGGHLTALIKKDEAVSFFHYDRSGNTIATTDITGDVDSAYIYEPYGKVVQSSGETSGNPFTFAGAFGVMDDGDGLYFMKNRYYNAQMGRFLQSDPIGILGGINLYAYGSGNPLKYVDPYGTNLISTTLFIGAIITTAYGLYEGGRKIRDTIDATRESARRQEQYNDSLRRMAARGGRPEDVMRAHNARNTYGQALHQSYATGADAAFTNVRNISSIMISPPTPSDAIGNAASIVQTGFEGVIEATGKTGAAQTSRPANPASPKRNVTADSKSCSPPESSSNFYRPTQADWDQFFKDKRNVNSYDLD